MAYVKGIVRSVDTSLGLGEIVRLFTGTGVINVYRCNRLAYRLRLPTESVRATFAGYNLFLRVRLGLYCIESTPATAPFAMQDLLAI